MTYHEYFKSSEDVSLMSAHDGDRVPLHLCYTVTLSKVRSGEALTCSYLNISL